MSEWALSVVVAVENSSENLEAVLERLNPQENPKVQFIFGFIGSEAPMPASADECPNVTTIIVPADCRIPHVWAEGIRWSQANHVGLLTGHFLPKEGWVGRALALPWDERRAAFGGVISNIVEAKALDWGIFIVRYSRYAPPQAARIVEDVAADNAVYRRDLILREDNLLKNGFWEPAFHLKFREDGFDLAIDPDLVAEQCNRYTASAFASQRYRHAIEFGRERAQDRSTMWIIGMLLLSPMIPAVYLLKVMRSALRSEYCRRHLFSATPWITLFLVCWGLGEARGYLGSLRR